MGEQRVKIASTARQTQQFVRHLLRDIKALEKMLESGMFELDITRIGAEQEIELIDKFFKPAPIVEEVLQHIGDPRFTTELAKFNIEANIEPAEFTGTCLSDMERQINELLQILENVLKKLQADYVLTGILPTVRKSDITYNNLTPRQRYFALMKAITRLRGGDYELRIRGIDELITKEESPLLEACNTGFQVHLQVNPDEFVRMYNIAQAITGPVLAVATNSPIMFGKRLWNETRVALFQQSVDVRKTGHHLREMSPRVTFGNRWMQESILDIYKEDIVRHRVLLSAEIEEDVFGKIEKGEVPELLALKVHNSTVYRWNRPCYGISNGKAHLRIENRVLPSGPSVVDEIANAAFWLGLMNGLKYEVDDITRYMDFDDAKSNFIAASRLGLDTKMVWLDGVKINASDLIKHELLPIAETGLKRAEIDEADIRKYLDIIQNRVELGRTGSYWILQSYASLLKETTKDEALITLTASMVKKQKEGMPVHEWELATFDDLPVWIPTEMLVEEFMETDIFTVQEDDIIELVAEIMNWQRIRYVGVENKKGEFKGLITSRKLLQYYTDKAAYKGKPAIASTIMIRNPITVGPEQTVDFAMKIMRSNNIGCLPVIKDGKLVGMITEQNFLNITGRLMKRLEKQRMD